VRNQYIFSNNSFQVKRVIFNATFDREMGELQNLMDQVATEKEKKTTEDLKP